MQDSAVETEPSLKQPINIEENDDEKKDEQSQPSAGVQVISMLDPQQIWDLISCSICLIEFSHTDFIICCINGHVVHLGRLV